MKTLRNITVITLLCLLCGVIGAAALGTENADKAEASAKPTLPVQTVREAKAAQLAGDDRLLYEKAIEIIKKYEGLHSARHWPLVGYGHKVLPGERYRRGTVLSASQAEELLRKDFRKYCALFRDFGRDSILMAALAYNIGNGAAGRSSVAAKLRAGDRDIRASYIAHSRYRGKVHPQIRQRRVEELEVLFVADTSALAAPEPVAVAAQNVNDKSNDRI